MAYMAYMAYMGQDAGEEQVRAGLALVYDRYARGYGRLYPLQDAARKDRRGLWSAEAVASWEWRKTQKTPTTHIAS